VEPRHADVVQRSSADAACRQRLMVVYGDPSDIVDLNGSPPCSCRASSSGPHPALLSCSSISRPAVYRIRRYSLNSI
jgi:hypothetical protein